MKLLRNCIIALSLVALLAVVLSVLSVAGYLTKADQAVVFPEDPMTARAEEPGIKDLAKLLTKALKDAEPLPSPPDLSEATDPILLQTKTAGGIFVGAYSLRVVSMIDRNALIQDLATKAWYRLSARDFELLLSHPVFEDLPLKSFREPLLTVGDFSDLVSQEGTVLCYTPKGVFRRVTKTQGAEPTLWELTTEQASSKPLITGTELPDAWSLDVTRDGSAHLSQVRVPASELFFPGEPGIYTYRITAHWDLSAQRDWYGDLTYVLEIHIADPEPPSDLPEDSEGDPSHP